MCLIHCLFANRRNYRFPNPFYVIDYRVRITVKNIGRVRDDFGDSDSRLSDNSRDNPHCHISLQINLCHNKADLVPLARRTIVTASAGNGIDTI